jgi:hypothetical protein
MVYNLSYAEISQISRSSRNALVKDGWTITDDPFAIKFADARLFADIGAEKLLAAEKDSRKIAVEVKVFGNVSSYDDLESRAISNLPCFFEKNATRKRGLFGSCRKDLQ